MSYELVGARRLALANHEMARLRRILDKLKILSWSAPFIDKDRLKTVAPERPNLVYAFKLMTNDHWILQFRECQAVVRGLNLYLEGSHGGEVTPESEKLRLMDAVEHLFDDDYLKPLKEIRALFQESTVVRVEP